MRKVLVGLGILLVIGAVGVYLALPIVKGPILSVLTGKGIDAPSDETVRSRFQAAHGYTAELFAVGIENARFLRVSPGGALLVSQPREGTILHILPDEDGDGRSDGQRELVDDLDKPHGLDFRDGYLYVGETLSLIHI